MFDLSFLADNPDFPEFSDSRKEHFLQIVRGNDEQRKNQSVLKQLLLDCEVFFNLYCFS